MGKMRLTYPGLAKGCYCMLPVRITPKMRGFMPVAMSIASVVIVGLIAFAVSSAQSYALSFGYDRAIQFVDPTGLNQVPFWVNIDNATVDFALYRLTPPDFVKRYAAQQPWQPQTID